MTLTEVQNLLTGVMRGIDKKTSLTVEQRQDTDRVAVTVKFARDRRSGSLEISEADLLAAKADAMGLNRLRTTLKQARERMFHETEYIFSTKMVHAKPEGPSWFRPSQGGGGRGRR